MAVTFRDVIEFNEELMLIFLATHKKKCNCVISEAVTRKLSLLWFLPPPTNQTCELIKKPVSNPRNITKYKSLEKKMLAPWSKQNFFHAPLISMESASVFELHFWALLLNKLVQGSLQWSSGFQLPRVIGDPIFLGRSLQKNLPLQQFDSTCLASSTSKHGSLTFYPPRSPL